jgi:hypothetical protein
MITAGISRTRKVPLAAAIAASRTFAPIFLPVTLKTNAAAVTGRPGSP